MLELDGGLALHVHLAGKSVMMPLLYSIYATAGQVTAALQVINIAEQLLHPSEYLCP